ncbi:alkaline phosphatase family protein [Lacimicrobium alkaliphilum]|uniref:Alkaline phosphatase family protein n=1 Tax=Lacimicrobium alkaliphilum TaxID=1526571 RepID=A0ABQ1QYX4_9ALTE|nr:alkaline phosphatase family protein [Lacimicrobium alkaliphilum]GGD48907.1 alkaline phosphatase family protein [Lacimicrobium alkaliphilum]
MSVRSFALLIGFVALSTTALAQPKLVLQITVDQLRGDMLSRYQENFVKAPEQTGFNQFLNQGTAYLNAHYRHNTTLTAVGHATLATGALPSQHGIAANNWADGKTGERVYCVADESTHLLGAEGYSSSPANLMASTFSDELYLASQGKAKIFSVSIKDRGAVLTGGQHGKSFWYDKSSGNMISSSFYFEQLPDYAQRFNQSGLKNRFLDEPWALSLPEKQYTNSRANRAFQIPPKGFNQGFPHQLPDKADKLYYSMLTYTPYGNELTADFARMLVNEHQLGQGEFTDYLAISFSVPDYVGHMFGPNSLEAEDNLIRLDRTLAELFSFLDDKVGLENVLIALSADHGVDAIPEYKKSLGFRAFRGDMSSQIKQLNAALSEYFKVDAQLIKAVQLPSVYLDYQQLEEQRIDVNAAQRKLADLAADVPGVGRTFTRDELMSKDLSFDPVAAKVQNAFVPQRSGDVVIVQQSSAMSGNYAAATHGSPYRYDTHVPLHFAGWQVPVRTVTRQVSPEDLAITLSALLGISQPDKATGKVLQEVFER